MRSSLLIFVFTSLVLAAGPATAQSSPPAQAGNPSQASPAPAAAPPAAESAAQRAERPRLMLRLNELDGPRMSFGPSAGEKYPSQDLPSLGGNARPLEQPQSQPTGGSAFPEASRSSVDAPR